MVSLEALVFVVALAGAGETVLLDFSADWCGPCRMMEPTMHRLTAEGYPVRKINIDRDPQAAAHYGVIAVPCFIMLADGREIDRVVGASSYARLVQMFRAARVQAPGQDGELVRGQSPDRGWVGHSLPRPADVPAGGRQQPEGADLAPVEMERHNTLPPDVAGSSGPSSRSSPPGLRAAQATVRLRVEDPNGASCGTGTIIDRHGQEALVLTCGHIFRDSAGRGRITAHFFTDSTARAVEGQLISYDLDRDVALVSIAPGVEITPVRVAPAGYAIRRGDRVFSVGCDHGGGPTVRDSHITAIDKYLPPPNIEVAGQPVDGRSGGGLFSADGLLIGVCNAADPADNEGIYASLPTIHWELDRIGQRRIYQPAETSPAPFSAVATPGNDAARPGEAPPGMPERMPAAVRATRDNELMERLEDTEIICIVRSRSDGDSAEQLFILDRPSRDLLDRLARESRHQPPPSQVGRHDGGNSLNHEEGTGTDRADRSRTEFRDRLRATGPMQAVDATARRFDPHRSRRDDGSVVRAQSADNGTP